MNDTSLPDFAILNMEVGHSTAAEIRAQAELLEQMDRAILTKLQQHIPEITARNIHQYKHRLQRIEVEGKEGYAFWLDYGTPDAVCILKIGEPKMTITGEGGNLTATISYE